MTPGIVAIGSFAGNPLDPEDCRILGLMPSAPAFAADAIDLRGTIGTIDRHADGDDILLFLGRLEDPPALAEALGLGGAGVAELALAALRCWGIDARCKMPGTWTLIRWNARDLRVDIATSYNLRDEVFIAQEGDRFAVAPSVIMLAGLPWIDDTIDPEGLVRELTLSREGLGQGGYSVLRQVQRVGPGTFVSIDAAGKRIAPRPIPSITPWRGSFDEAVEAVTDRVRHVVRAAIAPYSNIGVLLSGGLDSSLLAAIAVEELRADQTLTAFTSVAPPGTGLRDEWEWSQHVADHLGIEMVPVWPHSEAEIYRPMPRRFQNGRACGHRHYLYDALLGAAQDRGVELLLDGELGESSVTRYAPFYSYLARAKSVLRPIRDRIRATRGGRPDRFLARIAPKYIANLPRSVQAGQPPIVRPHIAPGRQLGFEFAQPALGAFATTFPGFGFRHATCFHDIELQRLIAGMPAHFLHRDGYDRALARAVLAGRVPEETRLRTEKRPFSPDYDVRLIREAPSLEPRLTAWRNAGIGDILDLDWVSETTILVSYGQLPSIPVRMAFQLTVMTAEFLLWWPSRNNSS